MDVRRETGWGADVWFLAACALICSSSVWWGCGEEEARREGRCCIRGRYYECDDDEASRRCTGNGDPAMCRRREAQDGNCR